MNLYLRLLWTYLRASSKPPIRFGDSIELRLRVWPNDLDVNGHMNNGRYMTVTSESPSFPKSVSAWIAAEDVIRA